jgi:BirA family biotin operon repressor/biotin-[acetyl-CoA-carboxylase] ligase
MNEPKSMESRVLAELREDCYSSGEAISGRLQITRSAVWKHIVKLRERGYVIEATPRHGYRLASRPDKLLPDEIRPHLGTVLIGRRILHYDKTSSTADEARRLINDGATEGTVVIAESQTQGRGRLGRPWQTPAGKTIAMSVILYPTIIPTQIPLIGLAAALALKAAVEEVIGEENVQKANVSLKWPNDLYVNGKKAAGILLEMSAEVDRVKWAVVSIGLNVNNVFRGGGLDEKATSLSAEIGRELSRLLLVISILQNLENFYLKSQTGAGLNEIVRLFEGQDMLQGRKVEVSAPDGIVQGVASGLDPEGRLLVRTADGAVRALFSGEATLSLPRAV